MISDDEALEAAASFRAYWDDPNRDPRGMPAAERLREKVCEWRRQRDRQRERDRAK